MTPLVSILIPSRKRVAKLKATLDSITDTSTGNNYEILIRFDDDDMDSFLSIGELNKRPNVKFFVGPRLGYSQLDSGYFAGLERDSSGIWTWVGGDDMIVTGDWFSELSKVPTTGFIVQPEISKLGGSTYPRAEAQAFPIFPRFCWKQFTNSFPSPFDTSGHALLIRHGWNTWFLKGVTFWHDRAMEREIQEHRK